MGCGSKSENTPTNPSSQTTNKESFVTAPVDYMTSTIRVGERTKETIELVVIRKAIESFQQEEGRNPNSLEELIEKSYLKTLPTPPSGQQFQYDAKTGNIQLVPKS